MSNHFESNSIFWVELDRIRPNPYQPRREFDEEKLAGLAESICQYGVLQPLVVTRYEVTRDDGGLTVGYELIAGERRLRASKIAGLSQIPVTIRTPGEGDKMKLEIAIIENLQREDLNPMDKARAFSQLVKEFRFKHNEIARKIGKSRVYVSNSVRLLSLPNEIQEALSASGLTEGHARPLLMLTSRPEEQMTLFREVMQNRLSVRDTEAIARRIATDRVRKKEYIYSPEILELEQQLADTLGTRVHIEPREVGGKIIISFFSDEDLQQLLQTLHEQAEKLNATEDNTEQILTNTTPLIIDEQEEEMKKEEEQPDDDELYSVRNFSI